jgi:steroid 5-alpha reductase family enzyme
VIGLLAVLLAMAVVMAAAWAWQKRTGNIGWVDVFWTFGTAAAGLALAWTDGQGVTPRRLLVTAIVTAWALRLGLYVAVRVARSPEEDGRYRELREDWGKALQPRLFWFLQAQAVVSTVLALATALAADRPGSDLGAGDLVGVAIAVLGGGGEALADRQLAAFRRNPANVGRICDTGLWGWSRHPNYLFEWLGWFAYPAFAIDLSGAWPQGWLALLAPAVMFAVLRFGTGVPPLEAHMRRTRGEAFGAYRDRVPVFIPFRLGRHPS